MVALFPEQQELEDAMRIRGFVAGAAAAGAMLLASPGWAGQAGSVFTDDSTSTRTGTRDVTVGGVTVSETWDDSDTTAVTLDSSAVTLSLQVFEDGYHGYSPANNIADFQSDVTNLNSSVSGNAGITTVQQAAGHANVTVSANTLVDLEALAIVTGAEAIPGFGAAEAFTLSPAFTVSNSKQAAQALAVMALGDAIANTGGTFADTVTAIEFVSNDSYEMSPENNLASFAGVVSNQIDSVDSGLGITTVQQSAGQANVQSAFNTILFGSGSASGVGLPAGY
jgi:hypothetical protein